MMRSPAFAKTAATAATTHSPSAADLFSSSFATGLARRFLPIPVTSLGAPYPLETACSILDKLAARNMLATLCVSPCVLPIEEAAKMIGGDSETLRATLSKESIDVLVHGETTLFNIASVHGAESVASQMPCDGLHRIYHRGRWHVAGQGFADSNINNHVLFGASSPILDIQHMWRGKTGGGGTNCSNAPPPPHQQQQQQQQRQAATRQEHQKWFSHASIITELDFLLEQHQREFNDCRAWVTPSHLPRTIATNGRRLQCRFALQKTLVPGAAVLPRLPPGAGFNFTFRPYHFWGRTGLRVITTFRSTAEEEAVKNSSTSPVAAAASSDSASATSSSSSQQLQRQQEVELQSQQQLTDIVGRSNNLMIAQQEQLQQQQQKSTSPPQLSPHEQEVRDFRRMTARTEFFAWFSKTDMKIFGLAARPGASDPAMNFVESRCLSVVPLDAGYLSDEALQTLGMHLPQPPARDPRYYRLLRTDMRYSMIPVARVEVPRHTAADVAAALDHPVADAGVLASLGIRPTCPPVVMTVRLPQAAWNVVQLQETSTGNAAATADGGRGGGAAASVAADKMPPWYVNYRRMGNAN